MRDDARRSDWLNEETEQVASATECTGLIPALPQSDDEGKHCAALYAVHRPKKPEKLFRIR